MKRFLFLCSLALLISTVCFSQSDRGTITGSVTDPAGAVVPGAHATARNTETGAIFETVTTSTGNYDILQLPAGIYELTIESSGFGKFVQQGIRVFVAQTARIDVTLQI